MHFVVECLVASSIYGVLAGLNIKTLADPLPDEEPSRQDIADIVSAIKV